MNAPKNCAALSTFWQFSFWIGWRVEQLRYAQATSANAIHRCMHAGQEPYRSRDRTNKNLDFVVSGEYHLSRLEMTLINLPLIWLRRF